ncbi:IS4 family transposase, partial [Paraburkholderia sp. NMBU_R16]|uniref:IS4 family transposase n=1 Tax=Paraburkholderia sp. NMBU_R16 TaxID=2698676 RepID=UPI001565FD39
APDMPSTRLVYVADREADLMALMERADALGNPADWLVRASHNRSLPEGDKLWERTTCGEAVGEIAFTMAARQGVKARTVRQRLWLERVLLPASKGKSIAATCLVAREFDAPAGVKPIEWRLLTNRAASTLDEAIELIEWYRARWEIEILCNVLKNGCEVEELQLGTIERLERALALFLVVAWRVAHLMRLGRTCPDLDAHLFFDPDEIRAAYLLTKTRRTTQPKLNEVLRLIARRGGFLARKSDGEPGAETIWKGLTHVRIAAETMRLLRDEGGDETYV